MPVSKPELVKVESFTVVGLKVRTKNEDELNPKTSKLHQLWESFFKTEIPNRKPDSHIYGVYSDYESDYNGLYTVTASVEVSSHEGLDHQFSSVTVKNGNYLVFKNTGPIPQAIYETWQAIWSYFKTNPNILRAYETDFEVCTGPEQCAIYIGIK